MPKIKLDIHDERLTKIFSPDTDLETLVEGLRFLEGPVWHPYDKHLRFSDIKGNATYQWDEANGLSIYRDNSHMTNGMTYDLEGRLLSCHHGSSRVTRMDDDETMTILASHYDGKELNSPNDIVVKSDGMIYFTDPPYGREAKVGIPRACELDFNGVYRLNPADGSLTLLTTDLNRPNGLCFSLDESLLYVADTPEHKIHVFDVTDEGLLANGRLFAETTGDGEGRPDGMKIDSEGNVYCVAQGGLHVFMPDGTFLGRLVMPMQIPNFTWGDDDLMGVYLTGVGSLYRVRTNIPAKRLF